MMDVVEVYLFGSYLLASTPHDIDLLWLYDKSRISPLEALSLIKEREVLLAAKLPVPIHHTILSSSENVETGFLDRVRAVFVGTTSDGVERILDRIRRQKG